MNASYVVRLALMSMAVFFFVHLAGGVATLALGRVVGRAAERLSSARCAGALFALRLSPPFASVLIVGALCVPSYLTMEPERGVESVGALCLGSGLAAAAVLLRPLRRARKALVRARRFAAEGAAPVQFTDRPAPAVALVGIRHPHIVVSRRVVEALTPAQYNAVLGHEDAHRESRDNLKRLAFLALPDLIPFAGGFGSLERAWFRMSEWAADDRAVAGDSARSLALAEALVRVARLGPGRSHEALASFVIEDRSDLATRVERLLAVRDPAAPPSSRWAGVLAVAMLACAAGLVTAALHPGVAGLVHRLLESLID